MLGSFRWRCTSEPPVRGAEASFPDSFRLGWKSEAPRRNSCLVRHNSCPLRHNLCPLSCNSLLVSCSSLLVSRNSRAMSCNSGPLSAASGRPCRRPERRGGFPERQGPGCGVQGPSSGALGRETRVRTRTPPRRRTATKLPGRGPGVVRRGTRPRRRRSSRASRGRRGERNPPPPVTRRPRPDVTPREGLLGAPALRNRSKPWRTSASHPRGPLACIACSRRPRAWPGPCSGAGHGLNELERRGFARRSSHHHPLGAST